MGLPHRAQLVIALTIIAVGLGLAAMIAHFAFAGVGPVWMCVVFALFVLASWLWPIVMFQGSSSQAHHLDEGLFILIALVMPPLGVVAAFTVATAIVQARRRRAPVKSIFNLAQMLVSVSAGLGAMHLIDPPTAHLTLAELGVGVLGAVVYFLVNSLAVSAVIAAVGGGNLFILLADGIEIRLLLLGASVSFGLVGAMAISTYQMATLFTGLPFWAFRQTLAGHYRARHDRTRLRGLFDATLDVHRHMGDLEVTTALEQAASELLRSPEAAITAAAPSDAMSARMSVRGTDRYLVVSGRSRSEPFDDADRALLDALAAVGSGALENASLYEDRRSEQERLVAITSSLGEGVCAFDSSGTITFLNPAATELLGWSLSEVAGDVDYAVAIELAILAAPARRAIETASTVRSERGTTFRRRGGQPFPVEYTCSPIRSGDTVTGAVVAFRDISENLAFEEQLTYHAFHDALTGLPNRRLFVDRLQHALERATRSDETHAVLFIDVDRFKVANDSLGHQAGDQLLIEIAARLRSASRDGDTLARFGGDEFTLLIEDVGDLAAAAAAAERLIQSVHEPVVLVGGRTVALSISVGVALAGDGATPDDVLHNADVAMYQAKHRGVGNFEIYDAGAMNARSAHLIDLEVELRSAIERRELTVYYQPVFSTATRGVVGVEALVRWRHPERGLLQPGSFISLAEETGLILPLGRFVLEESCRQAVEWSELLGAPVGVAVNLSARQFEAHDLVDEIREVISVSTIDPSQLCLEVTESLAHLDVDRSIEILTDLKSLGVQLAIDDFGTGYSSLSYLKRFPVDVVKLDASFIADIDSSKMDSAIVAAIVELARTTDMISIAEGVETIDQFERLKKMGCPVVQGYLLARPMPAPQVTDVLLEHYDRAEVQRLGLAMSEPERIRRGA